MVNYKQFLRRVPANLVREHLDEIGFVLPDSFDWPAESKDIARKLAPILERDDQSATEQFMLDADRVRALTDELGEAALYATTNDREALDAQQSSHGRAYCTFLHRKTDFARAEEARFADERRRGRDWEGFVTQADLSVHQDSGRLRGFGAAVAEQFSTKQVEVEMYRRRRPRHAAADSELVQATVYIEQRPNDLRTFQDGRVSYMTYRPVLEAAITYEPGTGVVEVVAATRERRAALARLFAEHLLASEDVGEPLTIRRYRVEHFASRIDFPTDQEDGIDTVSVKGMRLQPFGSAGERITLELLKGSSGDIWDLAARRMRGMEHGIIGYVLTQVTLVVRFKPRGGTGRGRVLPITITAGTGCNLKDCTAQERLIGEKYLRRWEILSDA